MNIKIPASLKGKFIQIGFFAIFTQSETIAKKIFDKLKSKKPLNIPITGKVHYGAKSIFWAQFGAVNTPTIYE